MLDYLGAGNPPNRAVDRNLQGGAHTDKPAIMEGRNSDS